MFDELNDNARDVYLGFKNCLIWRDSRCPIIQAQVETCKSLSVPQLRFYPEAIWGNPKNPIWFMGINPGQCTTKSRACELVGERRACANTMDDPEISDEAYFRRHDVLALFDEDHRHPALSDDVTSASLALLLGEQRLVCASDPIVPPERMHDAVSQLTMLNMAHCKCPEFTSRLGAHSYRKAVRLNGQFWGACGELNLSAFRLWKPRSLVVFGEPPQWWFERIRRNEIHEWSLDGIEGATWWYKMADLAGPDRVAVKVMFLPHPSHGVLQLHEGLGPFHVLPH